MKTAFLFSGQGSQYVGMCKDLYEQYPIAKELIDNADQILKYKLSDICFAGPADTLKETRYTQPALFVHSAVVFNLINEKFKCSAVAGHSVGEYAALYAAKVLNYEDALRLVSLRGELMFSAGKDLPGTMFAVIGMDDSKAEEVCKTLTEQGNGNVIVAANYNSPGQLVVSGSADYLRHNIGAFKQAGAKLVKELVVSGAFHSPLMLPAKEKLEQAIKKIKFNNAEYPVYSNVFAEPLADAAAIQEALIMQLTSPVKWTQTMTAMHKQGVSRYIELGPGKVLQGLVKRTLSDIEILGIDKAEDVAEHIN